MYELNDKELKEMNGGISTWVAIGLGAALAFLVGVVDGIARPKKCN